MSAGASGRRARERADYLPDFCTPAVVLAVVLISELVAVVLALGQTGTGTAASFWATLARTSLFLLWISLVGAAILCYGRPRLSRMTVPGASATALALLMLVSGLVSEAGWWLAGYWDELGLPPGHAPAPSGHVGFLARSMAITLIVGALALRYFYVAHQWRQNVELEATSRVNALQARIRPHFLFNSMNTIAALTRRDPQLAEEAIEDLADLFRASLRDSSVRMTLKEEFEIARLYQRIEQLRLGDRLIVDWNIDDLPMRAQVPGLCVQPLLENAIYHGVEPSAGGGTVTIEGRVLEDDRILIGVRNLLPPDRKKTHRRGNQMALENISERFMIAYGSRAEVKFGTQDNEYRVTLTFPHSDKDS